MMAPIARARLAALAATVLGVAATAGTGGGSAMSLPPRSEPLVWQGAADRVPVGFVPIRVRGVRREGGGLFGLNNSPSIVGALPDPRIVEGTPLGGGGAIKVRVPGGELAPGVVAGARVVLGLVDADHVICLLVPPADLADERLLAWAAAQPCG